MSIPKQIMRALIALQLVAISFLVAACSPAAAPTRQASAATIGKETAPASGPDISPTSPPERNLPPAPLDDDPDRAALLEFILTELAGAEKQHLLVAQVGPNQNNLRDKLNLAAENVLRAWIYQDGGLSDYQPADFVHSYLQESDGAWNYAYMAFSLNDVGADGASALVRIDRIPGRAGGMGEILDLQRVDGQWSVKRMRNAWIQ